MWPQLLGAGPEFDPAVRLAYAARSPEEPMSEEPPSGPQGAERRAAQRIQIRLPVEVGLPDSGLQSARMVFAELIDVGADGCGAAVLISSLSSVPLGGLIDLVFDRDVGPIRGRVVSRRGMSRRWRLGIRIDVDCAQRLRAAVAG